MFNLDLGTLYIAELDGSKTPLGDLNDINCSIEHDDEPQQVYINKTSLEASFKAVARISKEAILAITGMKNIIIECCPNRRVAYLAVHARKKRTRKKNFHRAYKILERMG